ncbi:MAG: MopE-related protein, partial [Flavobacteriales bacterium]
ISVTAQNTCGTSAASSLAVTVNPGTPAQPGTISGLAAQCPVTGGQIYSVSSVANATSYSWVVPTGWAITSGAGTNTITVSTGTAGQNGAVRVSASNSCGSSNITNYAVVVNARPTAVTSGSDLICFGNSATINLSFNGNGPFNGTLSNGQAFSASGNNANVTVAPSTTTTYTISTLNDASCPAVGGLTGSAVVTVNPIPTASITGSAVVCAGNTATLTITGPANGEVAYTKNGVQEEVALNAAGTATINTGNVWQNLNYTLVEVEDGVCNNTLSGSATVTYQELPDATITGSTQLCAGQSTAIAFNGNPNAVVTYNVNGGANQNITLNASGNGSVNTGIVNATTTYNLVSVASAGCSATIGTSAVVNVSLSTYYQDVDGDGYGNASVSTIACAQPAGYVTDNTDCCDNNANINPVCEWWGDMDGDGYGSFIYDIGCIAGINCANGTGPAQLIPYCALANFGVLYSQDCNDFSTAVSPAAAEVCNNTIDDDCDGFIGEGCSGQFFDQWATAQLLNVANTNAYYPNCQTYSGTMVNTDISAQGNPANVAVGGGRDVWYKFVAPSTGVRIRVTASAFNPVIELRTSPYTPGPNGNNGQVDVENVNP